MDSRNWPLIARDEEFALVVDILDDDHTAGVVLGGLAGVGKSRLAREVADRARTQGWPVVVVAGSRSVSSIPFGAFAHLIPDSSGFDANGGQLHILQSIAASLRDQAGAGRVLLVVDDGHLLDDASAAALLHVVRTGAARAVVTVRNGEPAADAVQALWKDELLGRLDLQPLGRRDVEVLVASVLGGPIDPASVQRLYAATGGNFLLLREVMFAATAAGTLSLHGDVWRWQAGALGSPRLTELVEARIGTRSAHERRALELVALGEPFELSLLVDAVNRAAVASLERDGLLVTDRVGNRAAVRLIHPIYATVIVEGLPPLRANEHRLTLASAVEATGARRRTDVLRSATWRLEAGELPPPDIAAQAATMANRLFDAKLARRFSEVALHAGGGLDAALALAAADVEHGRFADAERVLGPHEAEVSEFAAALTYLPLRMQVLGALGRDDHALVVLDTLAQRSAEPAWADLLACMRAGVHARRHEWDDALRYGRRLLDDESIDERVMLLAVNPVTMALCLQGSTDTCLALGDRAVECALRLLHEYPDALGWAAAARVFAMLYGGQFAELDDFLLSIYDDALNRGDDALTAQITVALGSSCLSRGLCRQAVDWLSKAGAVLRSGDPDGYLRMSLALLAEAQAFAGDYDAARSTLAESSLLPSRYATQSSSTHIVEAWLAAMAGESSRAIELLVAASREPRIAPIEEAQLLHHALRVGCDDRAVWTRLAALGDGVEAACMVAWGQHGAAMLNGTGEALIGVARTFASMNMWLVASEAAAQAAGAFRREGRDDSARQASVQSATWFAHSEAVRTPLLVEVDAPVALSKREREVAILASRGVSNAEIAEQLVLSVRTVESHLYRVMGKLGVERREELKALIR